MPLPSINHECYFAKVQASLLQDKASHSAPPPVPFDDDLVLFQRPPGVEYGHRIKELLFKLDPTIAMLNNGSYGACPKPVFAVRQQYLELQEFEPVQFFSDLGSRLVRVLRAMAEYLNVPPVHLNIVHNASAGTTNVLRSIPLNKDNAVVSFSLGYAAVDKQILQICEKSGAKHVVVNVEMPYTHENIIATFVKVLQTTSNIGIVVVDHITSSTGIIMPVHDIIQLCRGRKIPVLVDGAHAIGQIPIDLNALQPDFYVSNFHKWMFAPKSCALLYIRDATQSQFHVQPAVVSHGYGLGYGAEHGYLGTLDYSAWLSIPAALNFHAKMGGTDLMARNHRECLAAAKKLAAALKTSLLVSDDSLVGSFCVVLLPPSLFSFALDTPSK
ncbi:isopenicillin N-epimerase, partial [Thraustotheca clavata]